MKIAFGCESECYFCTDLMQMFMQSQSWAENRTSKVL